MYLRPTFWFLILNHRKFNVSFNTAVFLSKAGFHSNFENIGWLVIFTFQANLARGPELDKLY